MNIVNVGYDSTNYYLLANTATRLLIDIGWPGTLPKLRHQLKIKGLALQDINYLLCTHYHPDHAGLAQELTQHGARLIVLDQQRAAIPLLGRQIKPAFGYREILLHNAVGLSCGASRAFLERLGIPGEIIGTPGHSDDSVSLVLDTGEAFTGDLAAPIDDADLKTAQSWRELQARRVQRVFPGHGPVRSLH